MGQKDRNAIQYNIACDTWTTASGVVMPLFFRYQDNGIIKEVRDIRVIKQDKKIFSGIVTWNFDCEAIIDGKKQKFELVFRPETCTWVMRIHKA